MKRGSQGRYSITTAGGESVRAFIPAPLPPDPPVAWESALLERFDQALMALGRLDSVATLLPNVELLLYMYVRKEAVLSSMIEGTQSSLSDLLLFELEQAPGVPLADVEEVSRYVAALDHGLKRLDEGFPLSLRLLREIHGVLLGEGRGSNKEPGEFRRSQNWIGGTRPGDAVFVPPPVVEMMEALGRLELFLHDQPEPTPPLLKAALAHVQFETIHPFLDGNGRLGRLLITLLLCERKVLQRPLLYLSLYFKTHRSRYYELLNAVRLDGDWEAWLLFFADAVIATAADAYDTARKLVALDEQERARVSQELGRAAAGGLAVLDALWRRPIATAGWLSTTTGLTPATVNKALAHLERLGIVRELTARKRNRLFRHEGCVELLDRDTDPFL